jgi:hypothetical protein
VEEEMEKRLENQLRIEIDAINKVFKALSINAGCRLDKVLIGGEQIVTYFIGKAPSVRIADIERAVREITDAVSRCRRASTMLRFLTTPLRIETTHPFRQPLRWEKDAIEGEEEAILLGHAYTTKEEDLWVSLSSTPHILVAGATGAGKSVEMAQMLLGLSWNTPPAAVRIFLIDLKNTDLVPFQRLPHVAGLAIDIAPASKILTEAAMELKRRQETHVTTPRIVIVIDEYTDLIGDKNSMAAVDRIARQGRSANINLLVATQHPTSKALGGSTIKNNFTTRCIGQVADANAASNASGRPGTHAELLPKPGAFLLINGADITRFQSYYLDEITIESLITRIGRKWREYCKSADRNSTGIGRNSTRISPATGLPGALQKSARILVQANNRNGTGIDRKMAGNGRNGTGKMTGNDRNTSGILTEFRQPSRVEMNVGKFPVETVRELTDMEVREAIRIIDRQRAELSYRNVLSATRVGELLFGKVNNDTKRIGGKVISMMKEE